MSAEAAPRSGGRLARERTVRGVLDTTRRTTFRASSNLKGEVAGGNWWYALPSLEAGTVLCVGRVSAATRATLETRSGTVITTGRGGVLPAADASVDIAYVRGRSRPSDLDRVLKAGGVVVRERWDRRGSAGRDASTLWLAPGVGEVKALAPADDDVARAFAAEKLPARPRLTRRNLRHELWFRLRAPLAARAGVRLADLRGVPPGPPHYLRAIAQRAGLDLAGRRWALTAPGDYASQKVIVFLLDDAGRAEYVVKLTRAPAWNARLENEWRALMFLDELDFGPPGTWPRPAFHGFEAGLAVVGETAVDGEPFAVRTTHTAECPYACAAIDRLAELGAATADRRAATPAAVADALDDLLERFAAVYGDGEVAFLRDQIEAVRGSDAPFPLVLQHGDPGPWNALVTPAGEVAFLDWEAAEPNGLPLWDLFYFLRCYGMTVSRAAGRTDSSASFAEHFLADTPLARLLLEATDRACERIGLHRTLVEPLFYTCWMHRALKEATRIRPQRLQRARFISLLRLAIERREAAGLRALFAR